jgi:hypothetical protein
VAQGASSNTPDPAPAAWDRPADGPAIISEDFESGTIDPKKWVNASSGGATATVETDFVAHGKNALHIHYPAGARNALGFIGLTLPESLKSHFYGRAYVYMATIPSGHCVLMTAGSHGYPVSNFLEIGMRQNHFQPSFQQNGPNVQRYEDHPLQGVPPAGRWFCLEWEYNDKPDRIVMWIDGKLAVNETFKGLDGAKTDLTGGFFEYYVGFRSWSAPARDAAPSPPRGPGVRIRPAGAAARPGPQARPAAAPPTRAPAHRSRRCPPSP